MAIEGPPAGVLVPGVPELEAATASQPEAEDLARARKEQSDTNKTWQRALKVLYGSKAELTTASSTNEKAKKAIAAIKANDTAATEGSKYDHRTGEYQVDIGGGKTELKNIHDEIPGIIAGLEEIAALEIPTAPAKPDGTAGDLTPEQETLKQKIEEAKAALEDFKKHVQVEVKREQVKLGGADGKTPEVDDKEQPITEIVTEQIDFAIYETYMKADAQDLCAKDGKEWGKLTPAEQHTYLLRAQDEQQARGAKFSLKYESPQDQAKAPEAVDVEASEELVRSTGQDMIIELAIAAKTEKGLPIIEYEKEDPNNPDSPIKRDEKGRPKIKNFYHERLRHLDPNHPLARLTIFLGLLQENPTAAPEVRANLHAMIYQELRGLDISKLDLPDGLRDRITQLQKSGDKHMDAAIVKMQEDFRGWAIQSGISVETLLGLDPKDILPVAAYAAVCEDHLETTSDGHLTLPDKVDQLIAILHKDKYPYYKNAVIRFAQAKVASKFTAAKLKMDTEALTDPTRQRQLAEHAVAAIPNLSEENKNSYQSLYGENIVKSDENMKNIVAKNFNIKTKAFYGAMVLMMLAPGFGGLFATGLVTGEER